MDYCRTSRSRHDAGSGGGETAWTNARRSAKQAIEVAGPDAQSGASLLDEKGNRAPGHDARPRPGSPHQAASQHGSRQTLGLGGPLSPPALPLVEGERVEVIGPPPGRGDRPTRFPHSRERATEATESWNLVPLRPTNPSRRETPKTRLTGPYFNW